MNKMAKLPIFLGCVGAVCSAALALVNSFTAPKIANDAAEAKALAYKTVLASANYKNVEVTPISDIDISDELYNAGCKGFGKVDSIKACVYDFEATGYGGKFTFQVAFAEGKYIGFSNLSNTETAGFGADLLADLASNKNGFNGKNASEAETSISGIISGRSKTGAPLVECVKVAYADYVNVQFTEYK